jgi:ketosteroid isomerase-like protein
MQTQTDNIATVAGMYEALGRGDTEFIIDALSDDVDWATDAALPGAPWYGQRHGKDAVRAFFAALAQARPDHRIHPCRVREQRRRRRDGDHPLRVHRRRDR